MLETLWGFAQLGFSVAHGSVAGVSTIAPLEIIGERIVPVVAGFGPPRGRLSAWSAENIRPAGSSARPLHPGVTVLTS